MLKITIKNDKQSQQIVHGAGPLELGRGNARALPRLHVDDEYVSRDQLRLESVAGGRLLLENLSLKNPVQIAGGETIDVGEKREVPLPVQVIIGRTQVEIIQADQASARLRETLLRPAAGPPRQEDGDLSDDSALVSLPEPLRRPNPAWRHGIAAGTQDGPTLETLTVWLERVLALQEEAPDSPAFYQKAAQTMVDLVGLDMGLILLRRDESWSVAGSHAADSMVAMKYSRTLLQHVLEKRQTVYQDLKKLGVEAVSLDNIEAGVVAPIFGINQEVVGALYGMRTRAAAERGGILPVEAQLVQLLAAVAGANVARSAAVRTRVQFEQFFTAELVRELERDPALLQGRSQDVTVLASDLRGFTSLSVRLGADQTCRLMRALMERLSESILEEAGVIVDYAGDGILAMWNAPLPQADHAFRACRTGLRMLQAMHVFNAEWSEIAGGALALGIGINTGPAQVGNTGSTRKFNYGPRGHTVNLASRLQEATKTLGVPILISATARELVPETCATRRLGQVRFAGLDQAVVVHELANGDCSPEWCEYRTAYETALAQFESRQWIKACQSLMPLLERAGDARNDRPTLKLMRRAWECVETPPDPFDPVLDVIRK
ncbi:MAG TPA: adenylate/guanylate cyclase domain-containing protein [Gemmataceae bacterium]|jgi:adenylate cyclase|nr:adenylate/guanylate cyclase domain-containing protein [Gemmataceae bacterium]